MYRIAQNLIAGNRNLVIYFFIGVSASVIDLSIYLFNYEVLGLKAVYSTIISVSVATVYGFFMNTIFNFKTLDIIFKRFMSYGTVSFIGMMTSASILFLFSDNLGFNGSLIKIISLPVIFLLQYTLNKKFSFSENGPRLYFSSNRNIFTPKITGSKKVAIIGGGFTGLTTAYKLAGAGHKVTLIERENDLGGLAGGFKLEGVPIEKAYHFLYKTDKYILNLAKKLGLEEKITFNPSTIGFYYKGKLYPFTTPMDLIRFKPLSFINRIRMGIIALYLQRIKNWQQLSKITAYEWLSNTFGKQITEIIWEPLLKGKFNKYYDKVTMSWLWGRISVRIHSRDKRGEVLGYFKGGFSIFVDKLVEGILNYGGVIKTSTETRSIEKKEDGSFLVTTSEGEESFDAVVATIPSPVFAKLIDSNSEVDESYKKKCSSIDYLGAIVMVFNTNQQISPYYWHNIYDENVPFLCLLSTSALIGTESFNGKHVYYIGAYVPHEHRYFSMTTEEIEKEWKKGIKYMFPHFDEKEIGQLNIFRFKNAQHIVDIGYEENKLLKHETPIDGVYLSNFSQIYPDDRGTNFAVRGGETVADLVLAYLEKKEK